MTELNSEQPVSPYTVKTTLNEAIAAADKQNWSAVNKCLQQLPVSRSKTKLTLPTETEWQTAFQLATKVLLVGDFQQQWEVAKLFPLFGKSIVEPLIALLKDETIDTEVRWFICGILGKFPERGVILILVELLQQTEVEELAVVAGKTLTQIGTAAVEPLVNLLPDSSNRLLAVKSLAYIRHPAVIAPLITVVEDANAEIRTLAVEALGSFHDERIPLILITALKDTASSVRKEAANALGFRRDLCEELDLVAHLQPLLYDFNLEVCSRAAFALGRMKYESAVNTLFAALESTNTPVSLKLDLVRALAWSETELAIDYLGRILSSTETAFDSANIELVSLEIINVLGRITQSNLKAKATRVLIGFWQLRGKHKSSTAIKQILASSLGELQNIAARTVLEELAIDENKIVRLHAIAALKKLPETSIDKSEEI